MLKESDPHYLAGRPKTPNRDLEVTDKYTGETVARAARAAARAIDEAIDAAVQAATTQLELEDPRDQATDLGPIISESEARRIEAWIDAATAAGASLTPAILEQVPRACDLNRREVFGPVTTVAPFSDFDAALEEVNDSEFGLQADVFTRDIDKIQRAWDVLEVGGVIIGDVPSWRVDHMSYGGVKDSGPGREGLRFALKDMTKPCLLLIWTPE